MKGVNKRNKGKYLIKGMGTSFNIMGSGLELRGTDNIKASWHNVGIFYKRALGRSADRKGILNRFSSEELEVL